MKKPVTPEQAMAKMKALAIPFDDWDNLVDATPMPNRIAQILVEKGISPLVEQEDLDAMHLESETHWFDILKNKTQPYFFHEDSSKRNLFEITKWLDCTMCDIYGICACTENKPHQPCNCGSQESENRWRKI